MGLIAKELRHHIPFTILGALSGILIMVFFHNMPHDAAYKAFYTFHPIHVLLSALVTSSIYRLHVCPPGHHLGKKCNLWALFIIGYVGSVGIATLSDSVIPYLGEALLNMPNRGIHLGFIEEWWLVNPLAIIGIIIAYKNPTTKFPHAGHVFISTWASLFHIIMALGAKLDLFTYTAVFVFLFLAVWVPCCVSDIVFPLLFVKER